MSYGINIYMYRTSSNLYTPDSVSLASLARQLARHVDTAVTAPVHFVGPVRK